jgi:hypothetical protein
MADHAQFPQDRTEKDKRKEPQDPKYIKFLTALVASRWFITKKIPKPRPLFSHQEVISDRFAHIRQIQYLYIYIYIYI